MRCSVALFSLGWHELVPCDTHIYQVAVRDYGFPGAKAATVTPAINARVGDKLRAIWGEHAGWCQQVLFFADLKVSAAGTGASPKRKVAPVVAKLLEEDEEEGKPRKLTFEEEVAELIDNPGKRRRVSIKVEQKVLVKKEASPRGAVGKKVAAAGSPLRQRVKAEE